MVLKSAFMRLRRLGRSNLNVSEIGHGLWGMGDWSDASDNVSRKALMASSKLGCCFYDSAWSYGKGHSDRLLGGLLESGPDDLIAASKVPPKNWQWPALAMDTLEDVYPFDHVVEYTLKSRAALGRETIDVLQLHVWHDNWVDDPGFREMVEYLKGQKLINAFGLSLNRWEPENGIKAIETGLVGCCAGHL